MDSLPPYAGRRVLLAMVALVLLAAAAGCWGGPTRPPPPPPGWLTVPAPTWQWQLRGEPDLSVDADVFVLDPFTVPVESTELLHRRNRHLICYVRAGVYEPERPDATRFPADALAGAARPGGVRWLDVRRWDELRPILADRLRLCRGKGFEAVVLADVDGYAHSPGTALTFDDQLVFNRRLAALARSLDLVPGLGNDIAQVTALAPEFDFALNEECVRLRQCDRLLPFVDADKPVFHVEYEGTTSSFCTTGLGYGFASMRKERDLGAWRAPCLR